MRYTTGQINKVLSYHNRGWDRQRIAKKTGMTIYSVDYYLQKARDTGVIIAPKTTRRGRKPLNGKDRQTNDVTGLIINATNAIKNLCAALEKNRNQ